MLPVQLWAQGTATGNVYHFENRKKPLENVIVRNLTTNAQSKTTVSGSFRIDAKVGDILEYSLSGYHTDTLYLVNLSPKTIYLPEVVNELDEVSISTARVNPGVYTRDPNVKAPTRFETDGLRGKKNNDRAGGLVFNLGFSKYRRAKEQVKKLEQQDSIATDIQENYTPEFVGKLTKLTGEELKLFYTRYKPDLNLVSGETPFDYRSYVLKAFAKWQAMSDKERSVPPLPPLIKLNK